MSYNNELLFSATHSEIEVCKISSDQFSEEGNTLDINDLKVRKI
jgi:hypothetical protein